MALLVLLPVSRARDNYANSMVDTMSKRNFHPCLMFMQACQSLSSILTLTLILSLPLSRSHTHIHSTSFAHTATACSPSFLFSGKVKEVNGKSNNLNNCLTNVIYSGYTDPKTQKIPDNEIVMVLDADQAPVVS